MPVPFRDVEKILRDLGYIKVSQRGSHQKYKKEGCAVVMVPEHKELRPGTAKSIIDVIATDAGISTKDLLTQYMLKL